MPKVKSVIAFDVDGTLIGQTFKDEDEPRQDVIDLFLELQRIGCTMVVWSGGGVEYARRWAERLGLGERGVVHIVPKTKEEAKSLGVDVAFDDEEVALGKINVRVCGKVDKKQILASIAFCVFVKGMYADERQNG